MIEILTGKRETVVYEKNIPLRMHLNIDAEDFPLHWQNSFEIIMPLENEYSLHLEGRTETLTPGDIIIIAPGILHSISAPKKGKRYILLVNMALFNHIAGTEQLPASFSPYLLINDRTSPELRSELAGLMEQIWREYSADSRLKYAALYSSILSLFVLAGRSRPEPVLTRTVNRSPAVHKYADRFHALCAHIEAHCAEPFSPAELALSLGFSVSHFNRLFKQFAGVTFYEFRNRCRVMLAQKLLRTQDNITIVEISLACGFVSLSTFNRIFKAIARITPSEYRNFHGSD